MITEHMIVNTDESGNIRDHAFPPNKALRISLLVLGDACLQDQAVPRRRPHPDIAGKVRILGDIKNSVADSEWDLAL